MPKIGDMVPGTKCRVYTARIGGAPSWYHVEVIQNPSKFYPDCVKVMWVAVGYDIPASELAEPL